MSWLDQGVGMRDVGLWRELKLLRGSAGQCIEGIEVISPELDSFPRGEIENVSKIG